MYSAQRPAGLCALSLYTNEMQNTSNLTPGTLLKNGEYRIEQFLGQGGFGITYAAVQVSLGRKVAIKEFFIGDYCNRNNKGGVSVTSSSKKKNFDDYLKKFIKEAKHIASLEHKHIVPLIDIFEENGTAYYVMKYYGNGSLKDKVGRCGSLSEQAALRYIRQLASALDYVHSKRIMHLDVKPDNILLDDDDNVILIDFGLSKHYDASGHQTTGTPVGISEGYAPLEQYEVEALGSFTPATDVYSLGATLYFLVTGQRPPKAGDVMNDGLPALPQEISAPVRRAIEAAMEPKRKDRPQSVAEFLELLKGSKDLKDPKAFKDLSEETVMPSGSQNAKVVKEQSEAIKEESEETRALEKEPEQVAVTNNEPSEPKENNTALVVALLGLLIGCGLFLFLAIYGSDYPVDDESEQGISTEQKVDLGLSVCWAGWNVGASSPEGYGNYYAWGETTTKSSYTESSYQYHNGRNYVNIGSNISGTQYDVAREEWGGSWRMPTRAEFDELINRCTRTWTSYKGIDGYKVTGPNGNSIFLPAAGGCDGAEFKYWGSYGFYWSGTPDESYSYSAYYLYFYHSGTCVNDGYRYYGRTVRPVCDK